VEVRDRETETERQRDRYIQRERERKTDHALSSGSNYGQTETVLSPV
jgi:hypothetical protein